MSVIARVGRGLLAALAMVALVFGTPVLLGRIAQPSNVLVLFGVGRADPSPGTGVTGFLDQLVDALFSPDDGTLLIGLLSVVAWLAWAVVTLCIVIELINAVRGLRARPRAPIRLPGLRVPQAVAAGLVLAALSMVVSPVRLAATPDSAVPAPPHTAVATMAAGSPAVTPIADPHPTGGDPRPTADPQPSADRATRSDDRRVLAVHDVVAADTLWDLAEQYYGDGSQWRSIARANPVLRHHGPDDLQVGWQLVVPRLDRAAERTGAGFVVAVPGDTLSSLAADHLGNPSRWTELYNANRAVMSDPDELAAGTVLQLPGSAQDSTPTARTKDASTRDTSTSAGQDATARSPQRVEPPPVATEPPAGPAADRTSPAGSDAGAVEGGDQRRTDGQTGSVDPVVDGPGAEVDVLAVTRGVGGMLAAAVLAGLAARRVQQLRVRPVGRRISHPGPTGARLAQAFGRGQHRSAMLAVDRAMRLLAAHCRTEGLVPPRLQQLRVGHALELTLGDAMTDAPAPFVVDGRVWTIPDVAGWLATLDPHPDEVRPWPAVVTVGTTHHEEVLLVNLEDLATLGCDRNDADRGADGPDVVGVLTAIACELSFQPWAVGTRTVVLVDDEGDADWVAALDSPDVTTATDVDAVIGRMEQRAAAQRAELDGRSGPARRLDPDQSDAWAAEVVVVLRDLTTTQRARLCRLVDGRGRTTQSVVLAGSHDTRAALHLDRAGAHLDLPSPHRHQAPPVAPVPGSAAPESAQGATVSALRPHHVAAGVAGDITDLLAGTAGPTTPAPWWADTTVVPPASAVPLPLSAHPGKGHTDDAADHPGVDGDDGAVPGAGGRRARRGDDTATASILGVPPARAGGVVTAGPGAATVVRLPSAAEVRERTGTVDNGGRAGTGRHDDPWPSHHEEVPSMAHHIDESPVAPMVRLLGPIELVGARGTPPTRARKQCVEYCAWLLEHPGSTATAMASSLVVAEGTRRSNMSRLRSWLGEGEDGPYLPDAYSGRIALHDGVSSDWAQLQLLVGRGVDRAGDGALIAALELVRGAPLADAAPGQWIWAEELRTDIASVLRDIGVELSARALSAGNLDLARWAAARALVAAPSDELLLGQRIRTEHAAGNRRDVDRLAMQLATQSRRLGVDLTDETVELLQFVVEGAVRAREV